MNHEEIPSGQPMMTKIQETSKNISFKIFITVFILIVFHTAPNGSQSDRYIVATRSLVDYGTFALQSGMSNPIDTVKINDNLYSVIAPGLPILFAPIYYLNHVIMNAIGIPLGEVFWAFFHFFTNIFIMAPVVSFAAVAMFNTLKHLTDRISKQLLLVFIFVFGSLAFFYATNGIWVHAYTMSFVFIAFSLIIAQKNNFFVGVLLGLAQVIDYVAILPIFWILGFWVYKVRKLTPKYFIRELFLVSFGYSIFLVALLYYNYAITGSAFQTPNSLFLQYAQQQGSEIKSMFSLPSIASLWGLSFSPYRGIFLYFPMTFLFVFSLVKKYFDREKIVLFSYLFVGFTFLFNSTYYAWSGDSCFGPRHLVMAIPFIILPIANCQNKIIKIVGLISIFVNLAGVSTVPSNNILTNIVMFLYRGLFLQWLDFIYKIILPRYFNINLYLVTPFFLYVLVGFLIYMIWRPVLQSIAQNKILTT
ncbi:MAG: hypothetical protein DCF19_16830 [Pseudanabaena frigida]|uniref:Glycosyltransferase RgtA/B/C/D-like domain-containing protein n=1 Tax=Pseudanabaena frigida TaxID=945775 RepID=A0A2W4W1C4_9CYAN|nr:MAG: hypothetical protein DCF19_16830 [Pseudanabaena frigida]